MIRIDVPATSANLGSGFDSLGIALTMHNKVWMEEWDEIDIKSVDDTVIPTDESNLIYWAAHHLYSQCGKKLPCPPSGRHRQGGRDGSVFWI